MARQVLSPDREVLVLGKSSKETTLIRPDISSFGISEASSAAELDPGGMTQQQGAEVSPTRLIFLVAAASRSAKLILGAFIYVSTLCLL